MDKNILNELSHSCYNVDSCTCLPMKRIELIKHLLASLPIDEDGRIYLVNEIKEIQKTLEK